MVRDGPVACLADSKESELIRSSACSESIVVCYFDKAISEAIPPRRWQRTELIVMF